MNFDTFIGPNGALCVKPKNNNTYDTAFFLREMSQIAHIPETSGQVVLGFLSKFLAKAMSEGATLTPDGIGTFAPSLRIVHGREGKEEGRRKVADGNVNGNFVELSRITFRANPQMKHEAQQQMVRRRVKATQRGRLNGPDIDQRKELLVKLLNKKPFITSTDYMEYTHISRSLAYSDLVEFVKGGVITCNTVGRNKMYSLPKV